LRLPRELLKAAVDEAHSRDYRISVHTHTYEDALIAVQMGVDGLEHGVVSEPLPDDRLLEAMLERDIFLVSTLRLLEATNQLDDLPVAAANLKALHEGGVRVVAGSDTPGGWTVPGLNTIYELRLLVKAGLAPSEAIRAATYNAAVALEIEGDLGRVRKGLLADILVLSGNPLEDISVLHYPRYVIKGGEVVRGFE
ncbi:MAG: amidohydrolase family protein, partial [Haliea sp.]